MTEDEKPLPEPGQNIPEGGDLDTMLREAAQQGVIVVFGADGMTVDEIMHSLIHPQHSKHRLMIIGDAPHSPIPGGDLVN